jgi:hypothetical protein
VSGFSVGAVVSVVRMTRVPYWPSVRWPMAMSARSWSRLRGSPARRAARAAVEAAVGGAGQVGGRAQVQLGHEPGLGVEVDPAFGAGPGGVVGRGRGVDPEGFAFGDAAQAPGG